MLKMPFFFVYLHFLPLFISVQPLVHLRSAFRLRSAPVHQPPSPISLLPSVRQPDSSLVHLFDDKDNDAERVLTMARSREQQRESTGDREIEMAGKTKTTMPSTRWSTAHNGPNQQREKASSTQRIKPNEPKRVLFDVGDSMARGWQASKHERQ